MTLATKHGHAFDTFNTPPAPCADPFDPSVLPPLCAHQIVLEQRLEALQHQLSDASLAALPEFHQRAAVLRQLGYLDADNTVQLKGRVACEINSVQVGYVGVWSREDCCCGFNCVLGTGAGACLCAAASGSVCRGSMCCTGPHPAACLPPAHPCRC